MTVRRRSFEPSLRRVGVVAIGAVLDKSGALVVVVDDELSPWEQRAAARLADQRLGQGVDADLVLREQMPPAPRTVNGARPVMAAMPLLEET